MGAAGLTPTTSSVPFPGFLPRVFHSLHPRERLCYNRENVAGPPQGRPDCLRQLQRQRCCPREHHQPGLVGYNRTRGLQQATPEFMFYRRKGEDGGSGSNMSQMMMRRLMMQKRSMSQLYICQRKRQSKLLESHKEESVPGPTHFCQLKKDKHNNEDPSPIMFFKETHTNRKVGCMSAPSLEAYISMETKRSQARPEYEHSLSSAHQGLHF